jgi:hypothetical protein
MTALTIGPPRRYRPDLIREHARTLAAAEDPGRSGAARTAAGLLPAHRPGLKHFPVVAAEGPVPPVPPGLRAPQYRCPGRQPLAGDGGPTRRGRFTPPLRRSGMPC